MSHSCAKRILYSTMITNHMTNSLIGPILIRNSHVSAKFKLRSTGLSSEISLLRIRRETVTGLAMCIGGFIALFVCVLSVLSRRG